MPSTGPRSDESAHKPGYWRSRRAPLATLLVVGMTFAVGLRWRLPEVSREAFLPKAVLLQLRQQSLLGEPEDFRWVDPPRPTTGLDVAGHRFVALLHRQEEEPDVWLGRASLSPEGRFLGLKSLHNLSDTSAVAERTLVIRGDTVAWTVANEGVTLSVHRAELGGKSLRSYADWTWFDRVKTRLTFLQETGQLAGIDEQVFDLEPGAPDVTVHFIGESLQVVSRDGQAQIARDGSTSGTLRLVAKPQELGHPGELVTWAVDRVRALPWFGSDRMQWLKTVAFALGDYASRVRTSVVDRDGAREIRAALGDTSSLTSSAAIPDPETGWPPAALTTFLTPALPGEGQFRALDDDVFAVPPEGGSSPFAFAFLRTDPSRPHSQVFVVAWDPRRLELHTMSGTREPKTATGETGPGKVARTPEVAGRLAAAFNGGFQATHGEFGMMAERVVYLPPKPYAATVAELDDGTTGFGTWPEDDRIGPEFVGYRQNLTPLVSDGRDNPYRRTWWGGVPPGWEDATRTVRTGFCLAQAGHVAYFYGSSIDAHHLTAAMNAARCRYGLHLDMNPGHTGFEFYRVAPSAALPKPERKLEPNWQASGVVSDMPGWSFLGRRLLRGMQLMHFPRYVRTDSRDFFYLTHRALLTHERLANAAVTPQPPGLDWERKGLPQQGYPPALATGKLSPLPNRPDLVVSVVLLDAKWASPCRSDCGAKQPLLTSKVPRTKGELFAYYARRHFHIGSLPKSDSEHPPIVVATGENKTRGSAARAAVGTTDGQWLYYLEVIAGERPNQDLEMLDRLLEAFGCKERLFLERPLAFALGDATSPSTSTSPEHLSWLRNDAPMARRILEDTPVVPYAVWAPLQAKRIRYKRPTSASAAPPPTASGTLAPAPSGPPSTASPEDAPTDATH